MVRVYSVSDTVKRGGGGKKSSTSASKRKGRKKPKKDYLDPDWDPFA